MLKNRHNSKNKFKICKKKFKTKLKSLRKSNQKLKSMIKIILIKKYLILNISQKDDKKGAKKGGKN